MGPTQIDDGEIAGLTLNLTGSFDPRVFLDGLALRPIRYELSKDNTVTELYRGKGPTQFAPSRRIELDSAKFSVPGPKSIPHLFDTLLAAVAGLSPEARAAWHCLTARTADIGVYWTNRSNCGTEYDVPSRIVKSLGDAGISLRISVYATDEAIEKACREHGAHTDNPTGEPPPAHN
ncbi:MAG: hypothetical protein KF745_14670 [Phycisphaeraceae bacterium]|nr:hypothetical protein [Phycisphaeraceae bacterium]